MHIREKCINFANTYSGASTYILVLASEKRYIKVFRTFEFLWERHPPINDYYTNYYNTRMDSLFIERNTDHMSVNGKTNFHEFIYCHRGTLSFCYNDQQHQMTDNTFAILMNNSKVSDIEVSRENDIMILYIDEAFLRQSWPNNPYAVQAMLQLRTNPIMQLTKEEEGLSLALYRNFELRLEATEHTFYNDILRASVSMLMLDLLDFHARQQNTNNMSISSANIMSRFIELLENKEYRENREVAYYAKKLCVVPKYLSEVSNRVSGYSASYWINRYTSQEINELLRKKELKVSEIAKMFHFTSTSYFNRYVKRSLGAYPSELRGKL